MEAALYEVSKCGDSPDTSQRKTPVVLKLTDFKVTRLLLDCSTWKGQREKQVRSNAFIHIEPCASDKCPIKVEMK